MVCFSQGLRVWIGSPYLLISSQGELFLAADVKEILVECVQGLKPQTCFYFIEKEQSKETWPRGLYFSSTQQRSSENSGRSWFQVF